MADKSVRVPPELEDVATQVGDFIEYWGFKNVHGRVWVHRYLSPEPLDAGELIDRLGVSKALVSMSISDLLEFDVIKLAGKSERGTIQYAANPELMSVITNVLRKRERRMLSRVSSATRLLKDMPTSQSQVKLAPEKVESLFEFVRTAETCLDGMLQLNEVSFADLAKFTEGDN